MSNKNIKNSENLDSYSEEITKNLIQGIINKSEENISDNSQNYDDNQSYTADYNENYVNKNRNNYENYSHRSTRNTKLSSRSRSKIEDENNKYRNKIEKYGKNFFEDEDDEDDEYYKEKSILWPIINIAIIVVLTISTSILAISLKSTKNELRLLKEERQELIDENQTNNKILEDSLKTQILELESKLALNTTTQITTDKTTEITTSNNKATTQVQNNSNTNNNNSNNNSNNNGNSSNSSEYIVKKDDSLWKISKEVYGSGSHYQKILEANSLTETTPLKEGQKLIIPKLN